MTSKRFIAARLAASMRDSVSTYYSAHGAEMGYLASRACAAEALAIVKQNHGRRVAYELASELSDKLVQDTLLDLGPDDLPPAIAGDLDEKAAPGEPVIMVPGPGDSPVMYRNMDLDAAAERVAAAHNALQAALRADRRAKAPAYLRWVHDVPKPPLWFLTFLFGLVMGSP